VGETHTPSTNTERDWLRREWRKTLVSGIASFALIITLLGLGNRELSRLLSLMSGRPSSPAPAAILPAAPENPLSAPRAVQKGKQRIPVAASVLQEEKKTFPVFGFAVQPVERVPDWGRMENPAEWNRTFPQMQEQDFVPVPPYDLAVLTKPIENMLGNRKANLSALTAKLYYSTRFFGAYDLDAGEFTGSHAGIDLKLAAGTPISAIGGGRVHMVGQNRTMGTYVVIEHRLPGEGTFFSVYGHLSNSMAIVGDQVAPGETIGLAGMTGAATAPHLHLQIDRGKPGTFTHYWPARMPTPEEAAARTVHPLQFIEQHAMAAA